MHRPSLPFLAALALAASIPARGTPPAHTSPAQPPVVSADARRLGDRVANAESILRDFQSDPELAIPPEVLREARAIIVASQVKGSLIVGLQFGYGVILARRPDDTWSVPVFLRAGEASLGLQLGGKRTETIYVLMDDDTVRLLFNGRVNIGSDARAVAGPRIYEPERSSRELLDTPVLVYGRNHGYHAGAAVKTGWIDRDDDANRAYHRTPHTLPEILFGDVVPPTPATRPLIDYVAEITR